MNPEAGKEIPFWVAKFLDRIKITLQRSGPGATMCLMCRGIRNEYGLYDSLEKLAGECLNPKYKFVWTNKEKGSFKIERK